MVSKHGARPHKSFASLIHTWRQAGDRYQTVSGQSQFLITWLKASVNETTGVESLAVAFARKLTAAAKPF